MEQYLRREHIGCEAEVPETLKKRSGKEGEIFFFRRTVDRWPCRLAYHEREKMLMCEYGRSEVVAQILQCCTKRYPNSLRNIQGLTHALRHSNIVSLLLSTLITALNAIQNNQTKLPDKLLLIRQKWLKMQKLKNSNATF